MTLVVAIDAGHGGSNTGAVRGNEGHDQLVEKDVTLIIARHLFNGLDMCHLTPVLLRETDEGMGLKERGSLSAKYGADLVVSIHVNAFDGKQSGIMAYHWPGNWRTRDVAEEIIAMAPAQLRVKRAPMSATEESWPRVRNVMRWHRADTVLIECGFADYSPDRRFLLSESGRALVANSIRGGVFHYWHQRQMDKERGLV